jgi:undecaprenyl diphosphate synthase
MASIRDVAIIMDGNGRWAQARAHKRMWGHIRGSAVVSNIVEEAVNLKLNSLTLYAFSTENWARPLPEVSILFKLLKKFLIKERNLLIKNNVIFRVAGDISGLPVVAREIIAETENMTAAHTGLKFNLAIGYGGRDEILRACNSFISTNPGQPLTQEDFTSRLYLNDIPEIDLLIRTGGDMRISNFLLWQAAYAELCFTQTPWPKFSQDEFRQIIEEVSGRERRFGQVLSNEEGSLKRSTNV